MSKYVASIPLGEIERIQIYINKSVKTLAEIKAETGADYLINGGLYQGKQAVCHLRADGQTYAKDPYTYWGYAWDTGPDITLRSVPAAERRNYLCCVCLLRGGKAETLIYNRDVGGSRPRTAMGIKDGALCLYCTNSGRTPEELQAELLALGWESAVMLDGGGSSQCDLVGKRIVSNRKVHNLILVYTRKRAPSEPSDNDKEDKPMDDITQAIMTNSDCYKAGRTITPKGIMVHSTATPGADAQTIRSAWDRSGAEAAVHYIIDDQRTLQTLPDTCRAWHCGGAANNTHLSFEICEPQECRLIPVEWVALKRGSSGWAVQRLQMELQARGYDPKGVDGSFGPGCDAALRACQKDLGLTADGSCGPATLSKLASRQGSYLAYNPQDTATYFGAVWGRAVALCVQLCKTYGLTAADILCHSEGYTKGIASNHADVMHWWPYHSKTMDMLRAAVDKALGAQEPDYRAQVQARFGLAEETMDYLEAYKYGAALLQKLAAAN